MMGQNTDYIIGYDNTDGIFCSECWENNNKKVTYYTITVFLEDKYTADKSVVCNQCGQLLWR